MAVPRLKTTTLEFADQQVDSLVWVEVTSFEANADSGAGPAIILDAGRSARILKQVRGLGGDAQIVWSSSQVDEIGGAQCLRSQALIKCKAVYSFWTGRLCSHPDSPAYLVALEYTERWMESSSRPADELEREEFLDSLRFEALTGAPDLSVSRK